SPSLHDALPICQHLRRTAVADPELDRATPVDMREVLAQESRHGAPEAVDGLVRVPDDQQPGPGRGWGQDPKELELRRVDVLELVHEDVPELLPVASEHRGDPLQEPDRVRHEVTKVPQVALVAPPLVSAVRGRQGTEPGWTVGLR